MGKKRLVPFSADWQKAGPLRFRLKEFALLSGSPRSVINSYFVLIFVTLGILRDYKHTGLDLLLHELWNFWLWCQSVCPWTICLQWWLECQVPGKTERRFWREFHRFPPMVPHPPFFHPHVYRFCQFLPIFYYFAPKMVPHPCYKLKHGTSIIFFLPTWLWIPPIFRLTLSSFSASPVLQGNICAMKGE